MTIWRDEDPCGEWRIRSNFRFGHGTAIAKRGEFVTSKDDKAAAVLEPGDLWFEFGKSREDAVRKLKSGILS